MLLYLLIGLGGAIGSMLRFFVDSVVAGLLGAAFPWGTLIVNITGSFLIGFISAATESPHRWFAGPEARLFLMVGICGGYTTFSAFSLRTLTLARSGEWLYAGTNIVSSVVLCLLAVWLGALLGAWVRSAR
jgi:fluoride exporter